MNIIELNLRHFGKFEDHQMSFHPGINLICGPNESGKSTIHAFIRAMFFGFPSRKGSGRPGEYELRRPRVNPGYFEGSMRLEYAGKIYRIERRFDRNDKEVRLINETDVAQMNAAPGELQKLLMGMNEAAFVNTVFIRQEGMATDASLEETLRNYMMRIRQSGDGALNLEEACGRLLTQQKRLESAEKEEKKQLEQQISQTELRLEVVTAQLEKEREALAALGTTDPGNIDVPDHSRRKSRDPGEERRINGMFRALIWMCALAAFLGVICALVTEPLFMRLVMLTLSVILFTITGVLVWLRPGKGETPFGSKEREPQKSPEDQRAGILEEEIQKTARQAAILRQELDELYNKNAAPGRSVSDREAISLALERIRELSDQICTETGDGFDENASEILSSLTGGRYVGLALDERHQIRVFNGEELLMPDQVGSGTASLVYFAMRLAAGELMSGENLPLIMDDPFGSFDDERLEAVLSYLEKSRRQVILFTPGRREALLLEKIRAAAEAG